jgi:FkbM family methyltransferase
MNKYYAAHNIDQYVKETFFSNKTSGYFVDIGAHDGVAGSNSLYFENEGWDGLCFEPISNVFDMLKQNRKCKCINKAISNREEVSQFFVIDGMSEVLSGLVNEYSEEHIIRINREIQEHNQSFEYIDVQCSTFEKEIGNHNIDILSIDTEGSELSILKTIDFKKYNVNVMIVEYNYHNQDLLNYVYNNGFEIANQIGIDLIIKNKNYVY